MSGHLAESAFNDKYVFPAMETKFDPETEIARTPASNVTDLAMKLRVGFDLSNEPTDDIVAGLKSDADRFLSAESRDNNFGMPVLETNGD